MNNKDITIILLVLCLLFMQNEINIQNDLLDNYEEMTAEHFEMTDILLQQVDYWQEKYKNLTEADK